MVMVMVNSGASGSLVHDEYTVYKCSYETDHHIKRE